MNTASAWGGVQIAAYSTAAASQQTLTADQLTVFWSAKNGAGFDLFYAVRSATTDAFGPARLFSLSTTDNDYEPYIREDGCELHWSKGPGTAGTGNLYEVMFSP